MWVAYQAQPNMTCLRHLVEEQMKQSKFETTVKNLLKMNPKPYKGDSGSSKSQSDSDQLSSKRATKSRNSGED